MEIMHHSSVIEEIDVWLKETDGKGKKHFDVTNEFLHTILFSVILAATLAQYFTELTDKSGSV